MNREQFIRFTARTAIVAIIFTLLVSLLMVINYFQLKAQDPLELESLNVLVERLKDEPNNEELRNEIRNLDLLARKAFFTHQWQMKAGRYLLLFGGILWIVALRFYFSARSGIEEPDSVKENEMISKIITQRWIGIAGALLLVLAFSTSFVVTDHLDSYQVADTGEARPGEEETIETISLVEETTEETDFGQVEQDMADNQPEDDPAEGDPNKDPGSDNTANQETTETKIVATAEPAFFKEINDNHNGFRGPLGNGISYHKDIPVDWDGETGRNIKWKTTLSKPGYNSPVIWKDKLFIAGADKTEQVVYCLDINTGEIIWQKTIKDIPGSPAQPPRVTDDTGLSAPTTTTDGKRVYALFGTGDIVALDMEGNQVWARNLGVPDNHYGHSSSLILWNNLVLIQYDSNRGGRVLSLDATSGDTRWNKKRNTGISWASPILAEVDGNYQLVLSSAPLVAAYDPETGDELWTYDCMMGEVGPSPAFAGGLIYAANEYARLVAIKPGTQPELAWENDEYLPEVASPVVAEGLLFIATSYGVLVCYDALSGEKYWEEEMDRGFYASPMIADGKLYAMDMGGNMHIYKVSREVEKLGEPALGEGSVATPAFSSGRIYLRGDKNLYCIEEE